MLTDKILCVDDDELILRMYKLLDANKAVSQPYNLQIETAQSAAEALAAITNRGPYAVVLTDMQMAGMNGLQFLSSVRQIVPDTVRMMLTGRADVDLVMNAINEGCVFRFLAKPCAPATLRKTLIAGIEQYRLITASKDVMEKSFAATVKVLVDVLSIVNPTAAGRASRVRRLVRQLASELKVESPWHLEIAALLSQLGCISVPEDILRKVRLGAKLAPDEERILFSHPQLGSDLVASIPRLNVVAEVIASQEKRFDGSGVPIDGKKGEQIPFGARLLKVALDFDELASSSNSTEDAIGRLKQRQGWYDPAILEALSDMCQSEAIPEVRSMHVREICDHMDRIKAGFAMKSVLAGTLLHCPSNMVLAEDVLSEDNMLLLGKGQELTQHMLDRLRNYSRRMRISEPIRVLVPPEQHRMSRHEPSSINTLSGITLQASS